MSMRKQLTPEQQAKRDQRRANFKALWKQVADMPELERIQLAAKAGIHTVEGRELSLNNQCLLVRQSETVTVVGGFKQWLKMGRCVQKGQHGLMIWVPIGSKSVNEPTAPQADIVQEGETNGTSDTRFIIGTVFDISQTIEIESGRYEPTMPAKPAAPITDEDRLLPWNGGSESDAKVIELEVVL